MRTITVRQLESEVSNYLKSVRNGEEIVVEEHSIPIARILPIQRDGEQEREQHLVADGILKMPEKSMDWDEFFRIAAGNVPQHVAIAAAMEGRGDR